MKLAFSKMQGCGNDFVVCEGLSRPLKPSAHKIRRLADRRFGIGFDQLLIIEPPLRPSSDFGLAIYNSDGSSAAHCGNGARCAARFVLDNKLTQAQHLTWDLVTEGAACRAFVSKQISAKDFEVEMGIPSFKVEKIPMRPGEDLKKIDDQTWAVPTKADQVEFTPVNLGNPHAVIMVKDLGSAPVERLGPHLGCHQAFPEGVNVGFCELQERGRISVRVYERGAGETLACGSGACAAAAAARMLGKVNAKVEVEMPGGKLQVAWQGPGHPITLQGPAEISFRGLLEF